MLFGHLVCGNLQLVIGNRQLVFGNKQLVFCIKHLHIGSSQPTEKRPYAICKSPYAYAKCLNSVLCFGKLECIDRSEYLDRLK